MPRRPRRPKRFLVDNVPDDVAMVAVHLGHDLYVLCSYASCGIAWFEYALLMDDCLHPMPARHAGQYVPPFSLS